MRYNILGFDQLKAFELGLNLDELMILRHFHDFASSGKMESAIQDGNIYYWVKYDKFVEDLPILGMKKTRIMEIFNNNLAEKPNNWNDRLNAMSESTKRRANSFKHIGLLKSFTKKDKNGTYSFFAFTELFYSIFPEITDNDSEAKSDNQAATVKETQKHAKKPTAAPRKNKNGINLARSTVKVGGKEVDSTTLSNETIEALAKKKYSKKEASESNSLASIPKSVNIIDKSTHARESEPLDNSICDNEKEYTNTEKENFSWDW